MILVTGGMVVGAIIGFNAWNKSRRENTETIGSAIFLIVTLGLLGSVGGMFIACVVDPSDSCSSQYTADKKKTKDDGPSLGGAVVGGVVGGTTGAIIGSAF